MNGSGRWIFRPLSHLAVAQLIESVHCTGGVQPTTRGQRPDSIQPALVDTGKGRQHSQWTSPLLGGSMWPVSSFQCSSFQLSDLHRAGVGQPASVDTGGGHQHGQWSGHHRYNCLNMVVCFIGSGLQQFKALGTRRHWDL